MNKSDYDVVIVGAGVGGLVCGCYLAKSGLKTLIVEKNPKVGGCCTSFATKEFRFDVFAHSLGSCGKNGNLFKILSELGIEKKLFLAEARPSRFILTKDKTFEIHNNIELTVENLSSYFSHEREGVKDFFRVIKNSDYFSLAMKLQGVNFEDFFKTYSNDAKLHNLFSFLLFQSAGLPASLMSAHFGIVLMREYIFNGGYYPAGGMQQFPDLLKSLFTQLGGSILLNSEVKQIIFKKKASVIVNLNGNGLETKVASAVVSNVDPIYTLVNLFGFSKIDTRLKPLLTMEPSLSYLGVNLKIRKSPLKYSYMHSLSLNQNVEEHIYRPLCNNNFKNIYLDCFQNNVNCITLNLLLPFNSRKFWYKNKDVIAKKMIKNFATKQGIALCDIDLKGIVTPVNLFDWTHSYKGASFGWAPYVSQVFPDFNFPFILPKLYFVGQWLGMGHGISTVAYLGRYLAQIILNSNDLRNKNQIVCPWISTNTYPKS